jgi:hypothetical protein
MLSGRFCELERRKAKGSSERDAIFIFGKEWFGVLQKFTTRQGQGSVGFVVEHGVGATNARMSLGQVHRYLQNGRQADSKERGPAYQY